MLNINLQNIETLLFKNPKVKTELPELRHIFDQWLLSYRFPALTKMRKQALLDLLNTLDGTHVEKLARLFNHMVFIERLDHHIVKNLEFPLMSSLESALTECEGYNNIAINRSADKLYITLVR